MDMVHPEANPNALAPLLDCLKATPGRLKDLMKETTMECAKNVMALLKTHFPRIVVERVEASTVQDFNKDDLLDLADQYQEATKNVVKQLDL